MEDSDMEPLPVLEWLQIHASEFESVAALAQDHMRATLSQIIMKRSSDLMRDTYQSRVTAERAYKEYSSIVDRLCQNMLEVKETFGRELYERFPNLKKLEKKPEIVSSSSVPDSDRPISPILMRRESLSESVKSSHEPQHDDLRDTPTSLKLQESEDEMEVEPGPSCSTATWKVVKASTQNGASEAGRMKDGASQEQAKHGTQNAEDTIVDVSGEGGEISSINICGSIFDEDGSENEAMPATPAPAEEVVNSSIRNSPKKDIAVHAPDAPGNETSEAKTKIEGPRQSTSKSAETRSNEIPLEKANKSMSCSSNVEVEGVDEDGMLTAEDFIKRDPKLAPGACVLQLTAVSQTVVDWIEEHHYISIDLKEKRGQGVKTNELRSDLKQLLDWDKDRTPSGSPVKLQKKNKEKEKSKLQDDLEGDGEERFFDAVADEMEVRTVHNDDSESNDGDDENRVVEDSAQVILSDVGSDEEAALDNLFSHGSARAEDNTDKGTPAEVADEPSSSSEFLKTKDSKEQRKQGFTPNDCGVRRILSDSDEEDFQPRKSMKRKKSGSSASETNSDSDFQPDRRKKKTAAKSKRSDDSEPEIMMEKVKSKKKRRRVVIDDSSENSESGKSSSEPEIIEADSDEAEPSQSALKGRKNIRKIKDAKKETKLAEEEEKQRRKRIAERQKLFNGEFEAPITETCEQLVLDVDPETKEPLVEVDKSIVKHLKPHQTQGIRFMWDSCVESVSQYQKNKGAGGCILAHCMGLGKTLQTIAFIHTLLTSPHLKFKTVLVLCPLNTVGNWYNEFKQWTKEVDESIHIHQLYDTKPSLEDRVAAVRKWRHREGVGIIHYDAFRSLVTAIDGTRKQAKKCSSAYKKVLAESLLDPGPDIVICDEGHIMRNDKSQISKTVKRFKTQRRVILTGTPLQNNLNEYHVMVSFVKPSLLGSKKEFQNRFVNPINNGQTKDANAGDVRVMKKRAHVLYSLLEGCVQRLDYSVLTPYLPPKLEYVVLVQLSELQRKMYEFYLESVIENTMYTDLAKGKQLFKHFSALSRLWSHPQALVCVREDDTTDEEGSLKDFIDDGTTEDSDSSSSCGVQILDSDGETSRSDKSQKKQAKKQDNVADSSTTDVNEDKNWWRGFLDDERVDILEHGSKMVVLMDILKTCEEIGDKVLVFSQYLYSLDLIERFLEQTERNGSTWIKNLDYYRIDGRTKSAEREKFCRQFNSTTSRSRLFLISTKAGGLGINLYGANRVVLFDASWNPSFDMQSIYRVYRFGQQKPCYIYRLIAKGTMEERVYNRQVVKLSLSGRVVDEHQIDRHFTYDEIMKMYQYKYEENTTVPTVPQDRLLADLLINQKELIHSYFEHDSLLVNKVDEKLSEADRKAAWEEYENERRGVRQLPGFNFNDGTGEYLQHLVQTFPGENNDFYARCCNAFRERSAGLMKLSEAKNHGLQVKYPKESIDTLDAAIQRVRREMSALNQSPHLALISFSEPSYQPLFPSTSANAFSRQLQASAGPSSYPQNTVPTSSNRPHPSSTRQIPSNANPAMFDPRSRQIQTTNHRRPSVPNLLRVPASTVTNASRIQAAADSARNQGNHLPVNRSLFGEDANTTAATRSTIPTETVPYNPDSP